MIIRFAASLSIALLALATTPSTVSAEAPRLLLVDLEAHGTTVDAARTLSTSTCHQLAKDQRYSVMCGDDLRSLMQYTAISNALDACQGEACYAAAQRAAEARYIVSGSLGDIDGELVLSLTMIDNVLAKTIGRAEVKAKDLVTLHAQLPEAVSVLLPRS